MSEDTKLLDWIFCNKRSGVQSVEMVAGEWRIYIPNQRGPDGDYRNSDIRKAMRAAIKGERVVK